MLRLDQSTQTSSSLRELEAKLGYEESPAPAHEWWDLLVSNCSDFPLVIVKLTEELKDRGMSISEFFERYQEAHKKRKR